jgi:hypothetical protein
VISGKITIQESSDSSDSNSSSDNDEDKKKDKIVSINPTSLNGSPKHIRSSSDAVDEGEIYEKEMEEKKLMKVEQRNFEIRKTKRNNIFVYACLTFLF